MKIQFLNFGGGLMTGVLLVVLFSASSVRENPDIILRTEPEVPPVTEFHLVPLREFFQNVANYGKQHAAIVSANMRRNGIKQEPSRMFIYSIPVLEAFFNEIRARAYQAELNPDELAIRFYYAVYPDKMRKIAGHDYSSLHTLYMSSNHWSEAEQKYKDIDLVGLAERAKTLKADYDKQKSQLIPQFYLENVDGRDQDANAKVLMLDATAVPYSGPLPSKSGSVVPYEFDVINQGQLCPPNCPQNSLIDYADSKY
ncbi:MAG: hypothetical protein WD824_10105 [Cyclobacteriaceae bacterium]